MLGAWCSVLGAAVLGVTVLGAGCSVLGARCSVLGAAVLGAAVLTPDYPIAPVAAANVTLTDGFWAPKLETNRRVTMPHIMPENETTGRVDNFRKAAGLLPGPYLGRRFNDTDIYKVVEAAALSLGKVLDASNTGVPLTAEFRSDLLGGVEVVKQESLTLIPYYAWNNRGVGEMAVWLKSQDSKPPSPQPQRAGKVMAITFDDLPKSNGVEDIAGTRRTTESILKVLKAHHAPAVAFVNEGKLYSGPTMVEERAGLLRLWVEAGVPLGNHTFSHIDINNVPLQKYQDDVVRGERTYARLMRGVSTERWFRHPFTHTGPTEEIKAGLNRFLAARGYRIAPFTIENSDWIFSAAYAKAKAAAEDAQAAKIREEYLAYSERMVEWFETLAKEDFGRDIPQILLIHSNELHTDALDALLARIEQRGYRWVTLGEAMKDAAYRTPDEFVGTYGPSWLHRWRVAKKLPDRLRDEPDPPQWIVSAAK